MPDMTKAAFQKFMKTLQVPAGFTASWETEQVSRDYKIEVYVLTSESMTLRFDQDGAGHTTFKLFDGSTVSFDRRGIDDSFYHYASWSRTIDKEDLNALVAEQIQRVTQYLEKAATFISIPGLPFTTTPQALEIQKKKLRSKNGHITLCPAGFGTGYIISTVKVNSYQKRALQVTEAFFGTSPLYISTFDAD